jgi:hypothetical protein
MNFAQLGLIVAAIIVGILYMQRRRGRLSQED